MHNSIIRFSASDRSNHFFLWICPIFACAHDVLRFSYMNLLKLNYIISKNTSPLHVVHILFKLLSISFIFLNSFLRIKHATNNCKVKFYACVISIYKIYFWKTAIAQVTLLSRSSLHTYFTYDTKNVSAAKLLCKCLG